MADLKTQINTLVKNQGVLLFDGGLATELEARGHELNHPSWSGKILSENPEAIEDIHYDYLCAGANVFITSSYQVDAQELILRGINCAKKAVKRYLKEYPKADEPMIAASIGPYGAFLCDGSEYRGHYKQSDQALLAFHETRVQTASQHGFIAFETIPSFREAKILLKILKQTPQCTAFFSFSCQNETSIADGTAIKEVAEYIGHHDQNQVIALGVNCTAPKYILPLIEILKEYSNKEIVIYPNSGEDWDAKDKTWSGQNDIETFVTQAQSWIEAGAKMIGGCCRIGPQHIKALARQKGLI